MIAKTIHTIWFGPQEPPELVKKCRQSWQNYLPDFAIQHWNERNAPIDHPFVKKALQAEQWAFAADFVRFWLLYHHGGIYLDSDMEIIKDISPLLNCDFFLGYESERYLSGGIIGSKAQHPFCREVMQTIASENNFRILPEIITEAWQNNPQYTQDKQFICYPEHYFYPYNPYDDKRKNMTLMYCDIKEDSYAIHHWNKSWQLEKPSIWSRLNTLFRTKQKND